jgi:hypothetical protein
MLDAAPATPPKPSTAATIATMRKINAHLNILLLSLSAPSKQARDNLLTKEATVVFNTLSVCLPFDVAVGVHNGLASDARNIAEDRFRGTLYVIYKTPREAVDKA